MMIRITFRWRYRSTWTPKYRKYRYSLGVEFIVFIVIFILLYIIHLFILFFSLFVFTNLHLPFITGWNAAISGKSATTYDKIIPPRLQSQDVGICSAIHVIMYIYIYIYIMYLSLFLTPSHFREISLARYTYRQVSNIRRTLVGNWIVDHSDVVGESPVRAAPTTSSFST